MKSLTFITVVLVATGAVAFEQNPGGTVDSFTEWGLGVRSEGMGRTLGVIPGDATSLFWNPAGLYVLPLGEVTGSSAIPYRTIGDIYVHSLSFGYPLRYSNGPDDQGSFGTIATAIGYYRTGNIYEADEKGLTGRVFADTDLAFYLGYGKELNEKLAVGLTVKSLTRKLDSYSDTGFGIDLGALYSPFDLISLSVVARNLISPTYRFKSIQEGADTALEAGAGFNFFGYGHLNGLFEIDRQGFYDARVGAEITPVPMLAIRGGYLLSDKQPRAGLGVKLEDFDFDYAIRLDDILGLTHMASITFHFGGLVEEPLDEWDEDEEYIEWDEEEENLEEDAETEEETDE
ncbi:MAG: conjugal transfer protein TraF [bacterium]|nr:conjugal transfer protein TraF [bacterium]